MLRKSLILVNLILLMFIFGCQNTSNNNQQSENENPTNQEKHEHTFNEYKMDSEYHWYECEKDDCQYLTAPEKHDFSTLCYEEGNVDKEGQYYRFCIMCGYKIEENNQADIVSSRTADYYNWIRFKVIGFDLGMTLMSAYQIQECILRNISLEELQNEYAILKIVVLEEFNQYIYQSDNYSTSICETSELRYNIDNGISMLMIIPRSQYRHYILYEEYITKLYNVSNAYDEKSYIEDYPYIDYPKYSYVDRDMQVIYNKYGLSYSSIYFDRETKVNAIPICDGKIDFSRYTEEQLDDFFDFSNQEIDNDTIIRYLTHYPNKENEFSFDFTLEEIREWITKFSKYVYEKYSK